MISHMLSMVWTDVLSLKTSTPQNGQTELKKFVGFCHYHTISNIYDRASCENVMR